MILLGTIVNTFAIIIGSLLGLTIIKMKENLRTSVMQVLALAVFVMGAKMGFESKNFLLVIFCLVIGTVLGEWWALEDKLERMGKKLENWVGEKGKGNISSAFVTSTIVYCVGAMAILGALDSGLKNDHQLLLTKSLLDGFSAILFSSTLGIGVVFSSISVFIYQSALTLGASFIHQFISKPILTQIISELTATGGIMIMAISLNLLGIKKIRVANMLPALLVVVLAIYLLNWFNRI